MNLLLLAFIGRGVTNFVRFCLKSTIRIDFQKTENRIALEVRLFVIMCSVSILWLLISASSLISAEGWNFVDSIYFSFVTFSTIGYGDVFPSKWSTQAFYFPINTYIGLSVVAANIDCSVSFFREIYERCRGKCCCRKISDGPKDQLQQEMAATSKENGNDSSEEEAPVSTTSEEEIPVSNELKI